jgi:hypothetical protein
MSLADNVYDEFLDSLMNQKFKGPNKEEDAGPLPVLTSIWQCPMLNKTVVVDETGRSHEG